MPEHKNVELKGVAPPRPPVTTALNLKWIQDANDTVAAMEAEAATHEGRKTFYSTEGNGPGRALSIISTLDALRKRLQKFVRTI